MHNGEESGVEIGAEPPAMLLGNRANESVLNEIVGSGQRRGSTPEHSAAGAGFPFREADRIRSSWPPMFLARTSRMVRLSDGRRRNLDYGEAQSFQDLLLRRSLRGIGDELHAGLAGSSRISV
jgi:hypothetical protein